MKTLQNPWFIAGCLVWAVIIPARKLNYPVPFLNGYLDDAVAVPVIANLSLWFKRTVMIKSNYYVLLPGHVIFIVIYLSVLFEWLLPHYSATYTADYWDVLLYILGGLFFYAVMNKPVMEVRNVRRIDL
ncbi:hypothetical protein HH214_00840 [Mucilaginibacter robiniae]|uniref:Magnesium citrate secondary transporter n=1 Tax=Mucilaginibacter robiniae TaxID=2728022 RepID=A0A7L5DWQ7_9SPHI|nr:hypothetical protein [Mucilaginibacter robiniae]QJD94517.1 hypothetical protein HH214_00840 [Mucilaginibacter robiniae]